MQKYKKSTILQKYFCTSHPNHSKSNTSTTLPPPDREPFHPMLKLSAGGIKPAWQMAGADGHRPWRTQPVAPPPPLRRSSGFCRTILGPPSDHPRTIPGPRSYNQLLFRPLHGAYHHHTAYSTHYKPVADITASAQPPVRHQPSTPPRRASSSAWAYVYRSDCGCDECG